MNTQNIQTTLSVSELSTPLLNDSSLRKRKLVILCPYTSDDDDSVVIEASDDSEYEDSQQPLTPQYPPRIRQRRLKSTEQIRVLKTFFLLHPRVTKEQACQLSEQTGLTCVSIKRWFRNERYKQKQLRTIKTANTINWSQMMHNYLTQSYNYTFPNHYFYYYQQPTLLYHPPFNSAQKQNAFSYCYHPMFQQQQSQT